ncbi:MAG: hypothetical protein EB078_12615, partial [Proteobacteria bacterium]|nr:hypothetical protein [Pseudomonadota bacterium]
MGFWDGFIKQAGVLSFLKNLVPKNKVGHQGISRRQLRMEQLMPYKKLSRQNPEKKVVTKPLLDPDKGCFVTYTLWR